MAERVWRRSGGNPLFVRELTRLMVAHSGPDLAAAGATPIPASVRDILDRRLARLSAPCARLLAAAADRPAVEDLLDPDLLDEAVRARVLVPPADALGRHRFAHDLFRETVLAGLTAADRVRLHVAAGRALVALRADGADVHVAELAGHFVAAGTGEVLAEAVRWSAEAATEAAHRLGYEDARRHYERALASLERAGTPDPALRMELLLRLADVRNRAGDAEGARADLERVLASARWSGDAVALARAAVGLHGLGARAVAGHASHVAVLTEAAAALPLGPSPLRARVLTALARSLRYLPDPPDPATVEAAAQDAVAIARAAGEPSALAAALLALHDAIWRPGSGPQRLAVLAEMREAADAAGERDLLARVHQLRAAALIESGDPAGRAELARHVEAAGRLGHARGRWEAMTRQAVLDAMGGRSVEADRLAGEAFALGRAIGESDAIGVYGTLRGGLLLLGEIDGGFIVSPADFDDSVPTPLRQVLRAAQLWTAGEHDAARDALAGCTLDEAEVDERVRPRAARARRGGGRARGLGRAARADLRAPGPAHRAARRRGRLRLLLGAADHHLGSLAAALGRREQAVAHLGSALAGYRGLGAPGWLRRCQAELDELGGAGTAAVFRADGPVWTLAYEGHRAHLPDAKGLRDIAVLLAAPGRDVHVFTLLGRAEPATGADPVLDDRARSEYRARLAALDAEIDEAQAWQDGGRAERARDERDALMAELSAAAGLRGRSRRLGDETERARKTVTARIRDALRRVERAHPVLGAHLRASVRTGTNCAYTPQRPIRWRV